MGKQNKDIRCACGKYRYIESQEPMSQEPLRSNILSGFSVFMRQLRANLESRIPYYHTPREISEKHISGKVNPLNINTERRGTADKVTEV